MTDWYIDHSAPMPIYAQLERGIKFAIGTGKLRVGDQLPTVRQLAVDLKVNANTVAKVYAQLEHDGILETRRGVGTFVREKGPPNGSDPLRSGKLEALVDRFLQEAESHGFTTDEVVKYILNFGKKERKRNG